MNFQIFSRQYCWSVNMSGIFCCFLCLPLFTSSFKHNYYDDGSLEDNQKHDGFWDGVRGAEHITILDSENIEDFTRDNSESFVMFYANWCGASKRAKGEFAIAAQELAYTEGFSHIAFGAFDCNSTKSNQHVCHKIFDITKYPRFVYFKNGKRDRLYTVKCPRVADFFYNWVVNKGSEKYCAGSRESAKLFAFESSASSLAQSGILPCLIISFMISKIAFFTRSVLL